MNPALISVIAGLVQSVGPALVTYLISSGTISTATVTGIASIAAALGFTGWSAYTTKVTK